jgi:hypothetical protein
MQPPTIIYLKINSTGYANENQGFIGCSVLSIRQRWHKKGVMQEAYIIENREFF